MDEADPVAIFDTLNAFQRTGALKAAIELKVFTVLGDGPLEFIPNEDRISPDTPAAFALTMLMTTDDGDAYTFADYQQMFTAAGFTKNELIDVPKSPSRLVVSHC